MSEPVPPLPHTPSWGGAQLRKAQGQLHLCSSQYSNSGPHTPFDGYDQQGRLKMAVTLNYSVDQWLFFFLHGLL